MKKSVLHCCLHCFPGRSLAVTLSGTLLCVLLCSCGFFSSKEISVSPVDRARMMDYFIDGMITADGLAFDTENFLRGNLMQDDFSKDPVLTLKRINEYYTISQNPKYLLIAADLCRYLARKADPEKAMSYYLSAFYYINALKNALVRSSGEYVKLPENDIAVFRAQNTYNELCCGIFHYIKSHGLLKSDSFCLLDVEGHRYRFNKPVYQLSIPETELEDLSLCSIYKVNDLRQTNRSAGIGVPMVGTIRDGELYRSLRTPPGLTIPVTYLLKLKKLPSGERCIDTLFLDTGLQESLDMKKQNGVDTTWPLAVDFSTPLACFLNSLPDRNLISVMLHPDTEEKSSGLYMMEPYQPGKIPVVFVHGLMSSPGTWIQMINSLKNSPEIRKKYQFWFYYYSSGTPVLVSSKALYRSLMAAEKEFCTTPEATANFNRMVLVGHSMGGLLSRALLQKKPAFLMETIAKRPWEEIQPKLTPEERKLCQNMLLFPALPFVHRVVFVAVPHKGAEMAQWAIARFGARIIQLPQSLLSRTDKLKAIAQRLNLNPCDVAVLRNRFFTGIDNLDPENPFIRALGASPMKEDLVYHSIIGDHEQENRPGGSDGVVPYWSSHLDGAASEVIVKSGHSAHRSPVAVRELLRILLHHVKEAK